MDKNAINVICSCGSKPCNDVDFETEFKGKYCQKCGKMYRKEQAPIVAIVVEVEGHRFTDYLASKEDILKWLFGKEVIADASGKQNQSRKRKKQ